MDVILRNDPHVMDFNEYWNADDVYTESVVQSIGKALKKLWETFLRLVRQIRTRIKNVINKDARTYREMTAMLNDPEKVETLKSIMVYKHDYDGIKASLSKGIVLCHIVLQFATFVKSNASRVDSDGHVNWTENDKSEMNKIIGELVTVTKELKALTEWKPKEPVKDGCTGYEAILAWKEIYLLSKAYYASHDNVVKITDEFKDLLNDCPGDSVDLLKKIVAKWCEGFSYVDKIGTLMGAGLNARVDVWKELKKGGTPVRESYEYDELDELNAYIEATVNDLHEAMELRNELIQESDDDTVEDFEESDDNCTDEYEEADKKTGDLIAGEIHRGTKFGQRYGSSLDHKNPKAQENFRKFRDATINNPVDNIKFRETVLNEKGGTLKDWEKLNKYADDFEARIPNKTKRGGKIYRDKYRIPKDKDYEEYYSDAIIRNYDEPIEEETTYRLRSNDMFTESYDDQPIGPDRFVQEYNPDTKAAVLGGILGYTARDTLLVAGITADVMMVVKVVDSIIASATYKKKYGRFAEDMKAVMDILKESKDGTIKTGLLCKALHTLKDDCDTISGKGIISHKAMVNLTATERSEIKQLSVIIKDLKRMLTSKPDKAAQRRVSDRIEDFVKKCETVTKLLNRGKNKGDVVKEYMS